MDSKRFFIGNLPFSVDSDELRDFLEREVGPVKSAVVHYDRNTGDHRGFGFAVFHSAHANVRALEASGKELKGRRITIREAKDDYGSR